MGGERSERIGLGGEDGQRAGEANRLACRLQCAEERLWRRCPDDGARVERGRSHTGGHARARLHEGGVLARIGLGAVSDVAGAEAIREGAGRRMLRQGEQLREPEPNRERAALSGSSAEPSAAPRSTSVSPPPCAETAPAVGRQRRRSASVVRAPEASFRRDEPRRWRTEGPARGGRPPATSRPLAPRRARPRVPSRRGRGAALLR